MISVSVIIPVHNPNFVRFKRTLDGLAAQTLSRSDWELLVVDNGSTPPLAAPVVTALGGRIIVEPLPGLTRARLAGLREARGEIVVFVDDDNVLAPNFLAHVRDLFVQHSNLGAAGGPVTPEFEQPPLPWTHEFFSLLALRDLGPKSIVAIGGSAASWPDCAPVGAGLCVRRVAAELYTKAVAAEPMRLALDRTGRSLASGGDNDIVFTIFHGDWNVGYFPELALTHLIPVGRLEPAYLARLNRSLQRSWVRVLALHGQCPWPAIPLGTLLPRVLRAWIRSHAWRGSVEAIRFAGLRGRLEGQVDLCP